jgi:hypothetical protein
MVRLFLALLLTSLPALSSSACTKDADCRNGYLCRNAQCLTACGGLPSGQQVGCQNGYECIDINDGCDPRVGRNCPGTCKKSLGAPGDSCGVPPTDCPALRCACRMCANGVDTFGCCGTCVVTVDATTSKKECSGIIPEEFCPAVVLGAPGSSCGVPGTDCPAYIQCPCTLCDNGVDQYGCCGKCIVTKDAVTGKKTCSGRTLKESCPKTDPCDKAVGFLNERICAAFYQYGCQRDCQKDFCRTLYGMIRRPTVASIRVWIPVSCRSY